MTIQTQPQWSSSDDSMKASIYHGAQTLRIEQHAKPMITEPFDAIIKVSATTICGSDLHLYHGAFPGVKAGDILGHEAIGIVQSIGPSVKHISVGDRVTISAVISCGTCDFCQKKEFSLCDNTNPSEELREMYGIDTAGIFGYSHMLGGYPGTHAEFVRVPFADVNLFKIPGGLNDENALLLSDVACTAWHANELGKVKEGKTVAIWGAGPIGLMCGVFAKYRGASEVIIIDNVESRLEVAKKNISGCIVINFSSVDVKQKILDLFPGGVDVVIDAVGFRYAKSWKHYIEQKAFLETDAIDSLTEAIYCVKKGGKVSIIGDYVGYANHFPIGLIMGKGLTVRSGQLFCQKYWAELAEIFVSGKIDPSFIFTHKTNLDGLPAAFKLFDEKRENCLKVLIRP